MSTRLFVSILGVMVTLAPAIGLAQPMRASDFDYCVRSDDQKPQCYHRRTKRLTIVTDEIYKAVVERSQSEAGPAQRPPADRTPSRSATPAARASQPASDAQTCAALTNWMAVLYKEYPTLSGRSNTAFLNLFRDEYFVPHFGAGYLSLDAERLSQLSKQARAKECNWRGEDQVASNPVSNAFHAGAVNSYRQRLVKIDEGTQWRTRALTTMSGAPADIDGFRTLGGLEREAGKMLAAHWPSELKAFRDAVSARRRAMAESLVRSLQEKSTGAGLQVSALLELKTAAEAAGDAGEIIRAHIDTALSRYFETRLAEINGFELNANGRNQAAAWQRECERELDQFSGYPAARTVRPRIAEERKKFDTRVTLAMLDRQGPPSMERLREVDALRQSPDASVAERAREAFARELTATVQTRMASMPQVPISKSGQQAFLAWRSTLEKELESYRSEEPVRQALVRVGEESERLTLAMQTALVSESVPPSLERLAALRDVIRTSKDSGLLAKARSALERDLAAILVQRTSDINELPGTREGLQRFDSSVEVMRRDLGPYSEFAGVEQAIRAAASRRAVIAGQVEANELQALSQATPSFDTLDALARLMSSQNAELAARARAAGESMSVQLVDREIASAPKVEAGLDGTVQLARWASTLKQRTGRFSVLQGSHASLGLLAARLRDQRDRSLDPFAQSLRAAFSLETFTAAKRAVDLLPKDVLQELPDEFARIHAEELRAWTQRKGVTPAETPPGGGSIPAGKTDDPFGGLLAPSPKAGSQPQLPGVVTPSRPAARPATSLPAAEIDLQGYRRPDLMGAFQSKEYKLVKGDVKENKVYIVYLVGAANGSCPNVDQRIVLSILESTVGAPLDDKKAVAEFGAQILMERLKQAANPGGAIKDAMKEEVIAGDARADMSIYLRRNGCEGTVNDLLRAAGSYYRNPDIIHIKNTAAADYGVGGTLAKEQISKMFPAAVIGRCKLQQTPVGVCLRIEQLMNSEQKIINCDYQWDGKRHYYLYWHGEVPNDLDSYDTGEEQHPFDKLGRVVLDKCPAAMNEAEAVKRTSPFVREPNRKTAR